MIEIEDIENSKVETIPEVKTISISIDSDMNVVDIFNAITKSGILTSADMYELGSYLRTFADFHTPPVPVEELGKTPSYRRF